MTVPDPTVSAIPHTYGTVLELWLVIVLVAAVAGLLTAAVVGWWRRDHGRGTARPAPPRPGRR